MKNKKGLTLIEVLVSAVLLLTMSIFISGVIVFNVKNYKKNEVKIALSQEAGNAEDRLGADFRSADSSVAGWTDLIKDTPVILRPSVNSFYFYRRNPADVSEKITYSISAAGELLRNGSVVSVNMQSLTVTLKETATGTVAVNTIEVSINLSKQGFNLALTDNIAKRSVKYVSATKYYAGVGVGYNYFLGYIVTGHVSKLINQPQYVYDWNSLGIENFLITLTNYGNFNAVVNSYAQAEKQYIINSYGVENFGGLIVALWNSAGTVCTIYYLYGPDMPGYISYPSWLIMY